MDSMTTAEIIADLFRANRELVAENKILLEELAKLKVNVPEPEVSVPKKERKQKKPDSEKNPAKVANGKKVAALNAIRKELLESAKNEW